MRTRQLLSVSKGFSLGLAIRMMLIIKLCNSKLQPIVIKVVTVI